MRKKSEGKPIQMNLCSVDEALQSAMEQARLAQEEHERNGGMCQHCGKEKAEYPNGFHPYHCATCNSETQKIVSQLQVGGGFSVFEVGMP